MYKKRKSNKRDERVMVPLSAREKAQLEARARAEGISMAQIIRVALARYVEKEERR
jgi:hypothetical protein